MKIEKKLGSRWGAGDVRVGGQGRCERRIEVFVKIKKWGGHVGGLRGVGCGVGWSGWM